MKNAQEIFDNHIAAVKSLIPDNVIDDYADYSVFITPDRTYIGKAEILEFYNELLPKFDGFDFVTIKQETVDNVAYFVWHGKTELLDVQMAADTYIVENGKIKYHTFAGIIK